MDDLQTRGRRFALQHPRLIGSLFFLLGVASFYFALVWPIHEAKAGVSEIRISTTLTAFAILFTIFGLVNLCFGARFARIFQPADDESKVPATIAGLLIVAVALVVHILLKRYLESQGYYEGYILTR